MSVLEDKVAAALRNGDEVRYTVSLVYEGANPIAIGARIRALGRQVNFNEFVPNTP